VVLLAILGLYFLAAFWGAPQAGTASIVASLKHAAHDDEHLAGHEDELPPHEAQQQRTAPHWLTVLPFVLLLGAIAVFPLLHRVEHWWESNLHRFYVAAGLALLTLGYYAVLHRTSIERHFLGHAVVLPAETGLSLELAWTVVQNAIFNEFVPFIVLLFSLYTICGGVRIEGNLEAKPTTNVAFLGAGALLASFIGTTGAAMLLVRPLLETNRERKYVQHTVVFFIFIVCNCGGLLLPIGDPPLFLGYLQGVDFLWTLNLWPQWLLVNGLLLAIYFVWDQFYAYPREHVAAIKEDVIKAGSLRFRGLAVNVPLLAGVIFSVALLDPSKAFPGTDWHPWLYLREVVQLGLVAISLILGAADVRRENQFNYAAIVEVAALFLGIFICMQPALQILDVYGSRLGIDTPVRFFWATGALSSVLDNAPTYLVFFRTAQSLDITGAELMAGVPVQMLAGISLGAVFMGAMTYIGNGPNFMVKAIADSSGVKMPSFFGYLVYSFGVLLPVLALSTLLL
jgi:Na+/H+ antiporter NhaD/arsenite permease-like protein